MSINVWTADIDVVSEVGESGVSTAEAMTDLTVYLKNGNGICINIYRCEVELSAHADSALGIESHADISANIPIEITVSRLIYYVNLLVLNTVDATLYLQTGEGAKYD